MSYKRKILIIETMNTIIIMIMVLTIKIIIIFIILS